MGVTNDECQTRRASTARPSRRHLGLLIPACYSSSWEKDQRAGGRQQLLSWSITGMTIDYSHAGTDSYCLIEVPSDEGNERSDRASGAGG